MRVLSLTAVVTVAVAGPAAGCDLCAVYSATQARGEVGRGLFAGMAEQFTYFGTLQEEGEKVANPSGQHLASSISQLFAGYNFNSRFGLQFNLPVVYRSFKRPDELGGIDRGRVSGIGDASLVGSFLAYQKLQENFTFSWTILGGLKFPTGDTDRLHEELQEVEEPIGPESGIHGHDLTLGSGSVDGIVGTGVFIRSKRAFLSASVQYAIRSAGDIDYRFANDLVWSGGPGVFVALEGQYTVTLQAVVSGETKGRDTFQGVKAADTGITAVYLGPQVKFTWREKLSAEVGADLPVSLHNTALQAVPDYRIRAGLTWRF